MNRTLHLVEVVSENVLNFCPIFFPVRPVPAYPVVNGHAKQQYVQMGVERRGILQCSMAGVHPSVNLTLVEADELQSSTISLQLSDMNSSQNEDGTFDVSITATYRAALSSQSSMIQCKVTGEISMNFSEETTVKLTYPPGKYLLYYNRNLKS